MPSLPPSGRRGSGWPAAPASWGDARVTAAGDGAVTQICTRGEARAVERLDPMFAALGAAVDIGTTTLAAQLYDRDGLLATAAAPNPQRSFGADVISRIGRSMEGDSPALANCVRQAIAGLLRTLCGQAGRRSEEIDALVLTGNTAMLHLLCGLDVSPLAAAPFQAEERFGRYLPAAELDLPCAPGALAYLPRCMSAFVGADITTALLASGICAGRETRMLTDIGTNGEIALWHQGRLSCCSTAAGPAFEGANLSQGMQGAPGAIDHAWVADGALEVHTIGEAAPAGICGSGVADVLAGLLELGRLDETGLLNEGDDAWPLAPGVAITQGDIRQVQLAKSAVRAGIETLLARAGLAPDALAELAIAGGFGSYLSLDSAAAIGLIPPELKPRCRVLGNAALAGAAMLLRSRPLVDEERRPGRSRRHGGAGHRPHLHGAICGADDVLIWYKKSGREALASRPLVLSGESGALAGDVGVEPDGEEHQAAVHHIPACTR